MDDVIATLIKKLDLTAEEITDILWLALWQWRSTITVSAPEESNSISASVSDSSSDTHSPIDRLDSSQTPISQTSFIKSNPPTSIAQTSAKPPTPPEKPSTVPLYSRNSQSPSPSFDNQELLPFPVPNAIAIRNSQEILRSLRPLMQRVPSPTLSLLDEDATVEYIAQTELWFPQCKPKQEPWFELTFVVDASPSMLIWQRHVLALRRLLIQTGAFQDVRTWSLNLNSDGQLHLHPKQGAGINHQTSHTPEELIDPTGRRLILVVSDCISKLWQSGAVNPALGVWAEHGPMALVQMLPEWLWDRTALSEISKVRFRSLVPGNANQKLSVVRRASWRKTSSTDIKVPVFTLESPVVSLWSQMVAGKGNTEAPGLLFSPVKPIPLTNKEEQKPDLSAEERVQHFRIFSSPMARRLAGLLAGCPVISLPIIRIIQDAMLPRSQQVHVAEVLLSGLFKLAIPIDVDTNPDDIEYEFYDEGIHQILLDSTPTSDTFSVLSKWIKVRLRASLDDFIAVLQNPQSNQKLAERAQPFAEIAVEVLKRQGGEYARFANSIEKRFELPLLQTFVFEGVIITILQPFEFEVATIELKQTGGLRRKTELVIKRHRQQASGYSEDLGNGVLLEMVAIPEGSFMMGSPTGEEGHRESESPQHQVILKSFFMGKYPVTQAQWKAVAALPQINRELNPDPSNFKGANRPVERVSWLDAVEFCDRLSQHTNKLYRLPSEAEWEYACRAGTTTPFHFGETITTDLANYYGESTYGAGSKGIYREETTPVGSFGVANAFGLYDMHGNVWEWCADRWLNNYKRAPIDGSASVEANENKNDSQIIRGLRGGSWNSYPVSCRSACRFNNNAGHYNDSLGFRIVCSAEWT
ncbi:SAV_2336 N-terminal domain-related protein [Floridanema evergladense]|uniref:SAV_2336 N-terminal domain-related protein n=1 Tax=Floridaenema evergladense BLCC-F167 TaxID=3153639 RepID=A0ABV4WRT2_9CYAN